MYLKVFEILSNCCRSTKKYTDYLKIIENPSNCRRTRAKGLTFKSDDKQKRVLFYHCFIFTIHSLVHSTYYIIIILHEGMGGKLKHPNMFYKQHVKNQASLIIFKFFEYKSTNFFYPTLCM